MRKCTYAEVLAIYEKSFSNVVYTLKEGGSFSNEDDWIEKHDNRNYKVNIMGREVGWFYEKRGLTRGWSRKKKRKINNRLVRFFKNSRRRLSQCYKKDECEFVNKCSFCHTPCGYEHCSFSNPKEDINES